MMLKAKESVIKMKGYVPPTAHRKGMIRLDFNENTRGCSPKVISALKSMKAEDISMYPDYSGVKEKIAMYVGNGISKEQVMISNGSDEAIKCVMDAYVGPGDEVLMAVPTFDIFRVYATIAGADIIKVPYGPGMEYPLDSMISAITDKTKVIVIVNPNNPTGTIASRDDIITIAEKANNSAILVDEAYFEYYGKTCIDLVSRYDNIFVLRTFSKAFGLAAMRIGYVISAASNISSLLKVRSPYSIGTDACTALVAALSDIDFVKDCVDEVKKSRDMIYSRLSGLGIRYYPSSANFVLADFGRNSAYISKELYRENILARQWPGNESLKGHIRLGAGTLEETAAMLSVIESALSRKEAFIFDVDGVLVDVSGSYRRAARETCTFFLGEDVSMDEIQRTKNSGGCNNDWELTFRIIAKKKKHISMERIISTFQKLYLEYRSDEKWLLSEDVISRLSKKYRLGIFSGRPRSELIFALQKSGMSKYFNAVIAMEDVESGSGKPAPDGLFKALDILGCAGGFYAGDTVDDIIAARSAGLNAIGVLPPKEQSLSLKELLLSAGADIVIDDINKVLNVREVA